MPATSELEQECCPTAVMAVAFFIGPFMPSILQDRVSLVPRDIVTTLLERARDRALSMLRHLEERRRGLRGIFECLTTPSSIAWWSRFTVESQRRSSEHFSIT